MSKKQKQNKNAGQELKIVDEQKEPCLRALQKKVRNINKKLTQIADLEKRNDLKPEQEEKVNKKDQTLAEKDKYMEFISVYKEIAADNAKAYKQWQLSELKDLSALLVALEYGYKPDSDVVAKLKQTMSGPSSPGLTLKERHEELSEALCSFGQNQKLKNKVQKYIDDHQGKVQGTKEEQEQNDEQKDEGTLPLVTKQTAAEEEKKVKEDQLQVEIQPIHELQQEESAIKVDTPAPVQQPVEAKKEQNQDAQPEPQNLYAAQETSQKKDTTAEGETKKEQADPQQQKKGRGRGRYNGKDEKGQRFSGQRRERRGRRNFENRQRQGDGQGQRKYAERRQYNKKKYQEKNSNPKAANDEESSSSLESTPEPRQFKREEVRQLIEDGFIVVGKPKPKSHEQKQWYKHTHGGRKTQHGAHTKTNH